MRLFSANIESLQGLYICELRKALDMEQKMARALPLMVDNCSDARVCAAFRRHLEQTRGHIAKIQTVLRRLVGLGTIENCKVTSGLMAALSDILRDIKDPYVLDIALVGVARQFEHHEVAIYTTLTHWAELLDMGQDARILREIEAEELDASQLLADLSKRVDLEVAA